MELRGIIHNHSACSKEGCYPLSVLRQRWASQLDFAAMSEHAERTTAAAYAAYVQECAALSDERFRFIPGLEVATESGDMLLLGCRKFICTRDPFQVLKEAAGTGCLILLAHPEKGQMMPHILEQVDGMEGWNGGHMGSYMPPIDWLRRWRRSLPIGKILTGGNDIHKIDPKRKIVTLVQVDIAPSVETAILEALKRGRFITSNGIFACTSGGQVFYQKRQVLGKTSFALFARGYRLSWQSLNVCLELGGSMLVTLGIDKQRRTKLNRFIRKHL